jgi:hypothetical protein
VIIHVYHVTSLSVNLLFVPQLTQTGKKVEFWLDEFIVKDIHNNFIVVAKGILDLKEKMYKLCYFPKNDLGPTTIIEKTRKT